jgi:hypothetical protein
MNKCFIKLKIIPSSAPYLPLRAALKFLRPLYKSETSYKLVEYYPRRKKYSVVLT